MPPNPISDEDQALFRQEMRSVTPLKKITPVTGNKPTPAKPPLLTKPSAQKQTQTHYCLSDHVTHTVASDSILSYVSHSIPNKRFRQLRRGEIPYQGRIDLHGSKPDDACKSLCKFIENQHHIGNRSLLIIHGKGGANYEAPILKNLVNHWLKQLPYILAFHSALPKDGGCGALYVLLKR